MKIVRYLMILPIVLGTFGLLSAGTTEAKAKENLNMKELKVGEYFTDHDGTFIIRGMKKGKTFVYNQKRASQRFTPESTFKVPNALIGLQVGVVQDEYDIKYWDGVERPFHIWNKDHTLGSGMRNSVIWYYQDMARDIGENRMKEWVDKFSYGNRDISGGIDQFWLDSSLEISPKEQVGFIEQLYKKNLPFNKNVMNTVVRMMFLEEGDHYTLYGKTGTRLSDFGLGWFAGFIETENHAYVFVTNIAGSGTIAKRITMDILTKNNLMKK